MFLQIKDIKHIEWNFQNVASDMPQGWDLWVLGIKYFSVGICDGAPSTAHSCYNCHSGGPGIYHVLHMEVWADAKDIFFRIWSFCISN